MIKIENLVHKYTIWKDENTKSEKTVLDGIGNHLLPVHLTVPVHNVQIHKNIHLFHLS